jgi:hypothetical protein
MKFTWAPLIGCPGLDCVGVLGCADFLVPLDAGTTTRSWILEERAAARCKDKDLKRLETNDFLLGLVLSVLEQDLTAGYQAFAHCVAGGRVLTSGVGADALLLLVMGADKELVPS